MEENLDVGLTLSKCFASTHPQLPDLLGTKAQAIGSNFTLRGLTHLSHITLFICMLHN